MKPAVAKSGLLFILGIIISLEETFNCPKTLFFPVILLLNKVVLKTFSSLNKPKGVIQCVFY